MNNSNSFYLNLNKTTTNALFFVLANTSFSSNTNFNVTSNNLLDSNILNVSVSKEEDIHLYHMHDKKHPPNRIKFFETQFDHVQTQLTFAFWFFTITIAKILFQRFENVKGILPDSALLLVLGSIFGGIFHFVFPDEEIFLQPDWFFLYLLPPIALDAGYFMPNKEFFQNIGTITTYAVFGTLFNTASIGLTLYAFRNHFFGQPSTIDLLLFSTLISAVDPVAVICVFEEVHVLYHTLNAIAEVGTDHVIWSDYVLAVISFFWVSFGGIGIGIIWAILTGLVTKWAVTVSVVQPLTCLLFPYLAYLCAELLGLSGILAIVVCGMLMKQYIVGNISEHSKVTVDYFMKTLSSSCEAVIFVFLGLSTVSKNHVLDLKFIIITLFSCLVYRFIGVAITTYLLNLKRLQKINFVDQFIMGYGGIRGAVCYGLVMSLSLDIVACKHMFATTTIIVILFTVFIQGGSIKKLVTYLKVKQHEVYKKNVFEMIADNVINHVTGGIESIAGLHGEYWMRMTIERFNDKYIKYYIMVKQEAKAMKIVKCNEELQVGEAVNYLKQHGSFAGMPTVQSKIDLQLPKTQSITTLTNNNVNFLKNSLGNNLYEKPPIATSSIQSKKLNLNTFQQTQLNSVNSNYDSIPRNQSISGFVREKFDKLNSPVQMYSRHYLSKEAGRNLFFLGNYAKDDLVNDNSECYKTYPYSKNSQKDLLILNIRKASRSNSGDGNNSTACFPTTCTHGCNNCTTTNPLMTISNNNVKPKFLITSDTGDFAADEALNNVAIEQFSSSNGSSYSIGRFEVGSDLTNNVAGKFINGLPSRVQRINTCEEILIPLLTIEEQDEQHTTENLNNK